MPIISTLLPITVTDISASARGTISDVGASDVIERGFKYGLTKTDTWSVSETGTFSSGNYSLPISDLLPNTQYFIRSFATNDSGTAYGEYVSFYTGNSTGPIELKGGIELKNNIEIR